MVKIAINGLGRIGRLVLKRSLDKGLNVVAINDLADIKTLVYLLKYDSVFGGYEKKVVGGKDFIKINGKKIKVFNKKNPEELPWKNLKVDFVVESTGIFRDREGASKHLNAGAKKVLISAPAKNPDVMIVPGVNDKKLKKSHKIISMGSCTTNCLAPLVKVLDDKFSVKKGFMTTVHAYTSSQNILDGPHKKLRRGRTAGENIVPTTSGATTAVTKVIPKLKGKLDGLAIRVPVSCGSIVDFVVELKKKVDKKQINKALEKASISELRGILQYSEEELVSSDIIKNTHSSIVDGLSTQVLTSKKGKGNFIKVLSWYDNEYGYSCRLVDVLRMM